ncbi:MULTISPECIES: hypothetical protein [Vibrio]|uniref:hypothetical protein n=1 Tax=Vibrio TaxID=662 RepID=UPI0002E598CB|nr:MULTISPECIES: hypothetical protein [Vibrio]KAB0317253.1 hypothetical protein F6W79_20020 [Vibrio diabolicus]NDJ84145.1 hypothetical protein [Vibrio sp. LB10LO1]
MDELMKWISLISNIVTIGASSIAIYLFLAKKESFTAVFRMLVNYTYQLSLSEVKEKLEKLNEYNAKDENENEKIVNILNEIVGQIKGNDKLKQHFSSSLSDIDMYALGKKQLSEPKKRALVSELRERLRHLNVKNIDHLVGDTNE